MTERDALVALILWALRQDPGARDWGALRREAELRVNRFLAGGAQ